MKSFKMKKFATSTIVASTLLAAMVPSAQAATVAQTFDVTVTLTSVCQVVGAPAPVVAFGTYTAFQATDLVATPATFDIRCTRGIAAPTFALDGATNFGVLAGLNYEITTTSAVATVGTAPLAVLGDIGTADTHTITLNGVMLAGQAGTTSAGLQTATRTLTITY